MISEAHTKVNVLFWLTYLFSTLAGDKLFVSPLNYSGVFPFVLLLLILIPMGAIRTAQSHV